MLGHKGSYEEVGWEEWCAHVCRCQTRPEGAPDHPELEWQATVNYPVWALGIKVSASGRTAVFLVTESSPQLLSFVCGGPTVLACDSSYSHQPTSLLSEHLHLIWGPPRSSKTARVSRPLTQSHQRILSRNLGFQRIRPWHP